MEDTPISVTEAARNFADCVNRAHYQNQSFVLLKNGVPFARLVPAGQQTCNGVQLAEALARVKLPADEARVWGREIESARRALKSPLDPWQESSSTQT